MHADRTACGGRKAGAVHERREEASEVGASLQPYAKKAKIPAPPHQSTPSEREASRERGRGSDILSLQQDAVNSTRRAQEVAKEGVKSMAQVCQSRGSSCVQTSLTPQFSS